MVQFSPDNGPRPNEGVDKAILTNELNQINQSRLELGQDIMEQWPDLPSSATTYLVEHCPAPALLPLAIKRARSLVAVNPDALANPKTNPFVLDDCIELAKLDIDDELSEDKAEKIDTKKTTVSGLEHIKNISANLPKNKRKGPQAISYIRERLETNLEAGTITPEANEEAQNFLNQIETTLGVMKSLFTDSEKIAAFDNIIVGAALDFGADNLVDTFLPVIEQVEKSNVFSGVDKVRLRQIVTGSDVQSALSESYVAEDGKTYLSFTKDRPHPIRTGVTGYMQNDGSQIIEGRAGDHLVTTDVSGWSSEDVGYLIETMHFWNMMESFGTTGFVEDVYRVDFSLLSDGGAFDPLQIIRMRQVLSHMVGGFEGMDGDIANLNEKRTLLQNQARLLSDTQTAFGWENSRAGTRKMLMRLGLQDENGVPNMEVIKTFGDFTQKRMFGMPGTRGLAILGYLHLHHPNYVVKRSQEDQSRLRLVRRERNRKKSES